MTKKKIDITGDKYGKLTVIKEVEQIGYSRRFLCKCDCGKEKIFYMNAIRTGKTKSCGCAKNENISKKNSKDLTGKKFGMLKVMERMGSHRRKVKWKCICDCGNETIVLSTRLTSGITKSCGCLKDVTGDALQEYNEENLRIDDVFIPLLTSKVRVDNNTGVKGVTIVKLKNGTTKYKAMISVKGKSYYLGRYDTLEDATRARKEGEEKYHKPYLE